MAWTKATRISIMLAIDVAFFLVELATGFLVHSLALMADAFHMLNDIISLLVGLWAVNLVRKATTDKYTYGWLRAEILGAFFNAVFLIALCVSIVLEAVTRFFDPPEISNPKLILIVGCLGLASNLVGFIVLGGHGHSHGHDQGEDGHAHSHYHDHDHDHDQVSAAEHGRLGAADDDNGPILEYLPEVAVSRYLHNSPAPVGSKPISFEEASQCPKTNAFKHGHRLASRRGPNSGHTQVTNIGDVSIHPSSFRQDIIVASKTQPHASIDRPDGSDDENAVADDSPMENTPLISKHGNGGSAEHAGPTPKRSRRDSGLHYSHNHNKPRKTSQSSHGHNHGDMGMNAMILHVIGDALGNVGVIVTALVIWLTDWSWKNYTDPAASLFITLIILKSALPLTFATSKILLQATPESIDVQDIREDIMSLPGVITCHHVHIWQLTDSQIVASMHVQVAFPISEARGKQYMILAKRIRKCLHAYGIHAATIQPEFCLDDTHGHVEDAEHQLWHTDGSAEMRRCAGAEQDRCLLECIDDCVGQGCCSASTAVGSSTGGRSGSPSSHSADSRGLADGDGHQHH